MRLYSYVVRYDSGFAPNPFYGLCTLASCKPKIRKFSAVGDWIVGCGSNDKSIRRGGHLVFALKVGEVLSFDAYNADPRFQCKVPYRRGSRKQSCGDNIYYRSTPQASFRQRDSFHSMPDGTPNVEHIKHDTKVNRVLVGSEFVYFGGYGPRFPPRLDNPDGSGICKKGRGDARFDDPALIAVALEWIRSLGVSGFQAAPFEWRRSRERQR